MHPYTAAEGWHIIDGFYYVISMLCGLPNPLTDVNPDTDLGKFVDIVIALWQGTGGPQLRSSLCITVSCV